MSNEEKVLSMLETLVQGQATLAAEVTEIKTNITAIKQEQHIIKELQQRASKKLDSVFDHAATLTENITVINNKLDCIEREVTKHEEIILRKVK